MEHLERHDEAAALVEHLEQYYAEVTLVALQISLMYYRGAVSSGMCMSRLAQTCSNGPAIWQHFDKFPVLDADRCVCHTGQDQRLPEVREEDPRPKCQAPCRRYHQCHAPWWWPWR
mmetsp:Transcript_75525/g.189954  ORF Transcript_75525/g.189954 Transcript_75525/m.189954 type:complete len:116 (+) Transcript_75525:445-792(+)